MKRILLLVCAAFISCSAFAGDVYKLDKKHTSVLWHVSHFGFSNSSGKWYAEGTLTIDDTNSQNSKVDATIKMAELSTGLEILDKHLKGKEFFDVEKFPIATFVSNKVTLTGKNSAKVEGTLTIHGISKPVTLDVTLNKKAVNPISNKESIGFTAKTTLKRSDFGMLTFLPGVGDEVKIDIEAEAGK